MRKSLKSFLSLLLTLAMVVSLLPAAVFANGTEIVHEAASIVETETGSEVESAVKSVSVNPVSDHVAMIGEQGYATLAEAIAAAQVGDTIGIQADVNASEIIIIDKGITLDGNGHTLTSTAGRAINVSGANGVTIQKLTINASGERAINIIQNATNVTIDNVTAASANYTVNVASSALGAVVAIKNSNLTGLNVVNVASAGADITIDNTTLTTVDNAANEGYASICLNKDAVTGKIVATQTTVNITGSNAGDSKVAKNGAEGGYVSVNGSTDDVACDVAYISYGDNYYGFATIEAAIAKAEPGETVVLIRNVELSEALTIPADKKITLDLNGKTVVYNSTVQNEAMITNKGNLTINDTVGTGVINYNYTGAADPSHQKGNYTISNGGTLTVNGGKITVANLRAHAKYPIDNNSTEGNAILVINGGHLYNYNTSAIRQFCNSTTYKNSVTINGGVIEGYSAIWMQNPGSKTVNGSLTITGGEIKTTAAAYVNGTSALEEVSSAIYCTTKGGAWDEASAVSITGGTFNENVNLAENAPEAIIVEGATFNGYVEVPEGDETGEDETDVPKINVDDNVVDNNVVTDEFKKEAAAALSAAHNAVEGGLNVSITAADSDKGTVTYDIKPTNANYTVPNDGLSMSFAVNGIAEKTAYVVHTHTVENKTTHYVHSGTVNDGKVSITNKVGFSTFTVTANGLQAAIDAAATNDTIVLLANINLTEGVTIPAGKTITLELNGKTISQTKEQTAGYQMILNDGNLTITDNSSEKNGKISYTDSGNGGEYISDTIYNRGTLVIDGGTIENLSSATVAFNGYPHAVDTYSGIRDTSVTINGGTICCGEYSAIRMFCVSATYKADLVINGGTIKGAVDMQNGTKDAALGSLTINGGTFDTTANANNIRFANWNGGATGYGITATIKGGNFDGGITTAYVPAVANWNSKIISGGTFSADPSAYLAEGYAVNDNGNGYGVQAYQWNGQTIANLNDLIAFRNAVNAGNDFAGKTVTLTADIDLTGVVWTPIGSSNYDKSPADAKKFAGTFDGGNYTITGLSSVGYVPAAEDTGSTEYSFGLFGYVYGANISNVKFAEVNIDCGTRTDSAGNEVYGSGIAALIGYYFPANEKVTVIENCHVLSGTVKASNNMGGLIGHMDSQTSQPKVDITIKNCSNAAAVTTEAREAGGILGLMNSAREGNHNATMRGTVTFKDCVNTGDITSLGAGAPSAGGILGRDHNQQAGQHLKVIFDGCKNSGNINVTANGETHAGGIAAGYYSNGAWFVLKDCANTGNITVNGSGKIYAGGLISYGGVIDLINSTSTGTVTGGNDNTYVGDANSILFINDMVGYNDIVSGYTYYLNGGTSPERAALVDDAAYGGNFHLVETAYKEGVEFLGWYTNPKLTGEAVTVLDKNVKTYYAKWSIADIEIYDWDDLKALDARVESGDMLEGVTVKLMNDIDLYEMGTDGEPVSFNPIGNYNKPFSGTFDGQGYTIKNMYQSGWAFGFEWGVYGSIGLFGGLENATVKNLTIEKAECYVEGGDVGAITGSAEGNCEFTNISVKSSTFATYNNGCGGLIGWAGAGEYIFTNVAVDEETVIAGLWGSFDSSLGGVMGQLDQGATATFNNVSVACRLDAYNDVTASYKWYSYRMCGMLIGRMTTLQEGSNDVDPRGIVTLNEVYVTIGDWANYTYIWDDSLNYGCQRVEPGYSYGGVNVANYPNAKIETLEFATIIGGPQSNAQGYYGSDVTKLDALNGFATEILYVNGLDLFDRSAVAQIGDIYYATLADAIAAANGDTIVLLKNINLTEGVTIPAGKTVTLDLNGKTISQSKKCTASYEMINNRGNLTITGSGKISFTDTGVGDPSFGWGSYTIRNEGTLVVENGTIEFKGNQEFATHCSLAIFQYSGSTTINGGKIINNAYRSVRLWKGDMTINGGEFEGQVWVQAADNSAKLFIKGGTFAPATSGDASSVFVTNSGYNVEFAVTGGTFKTKIGANDVDALAGAITGGKFTEVAKEETKDILVKAGSMIGGTEVDGYYGVVEDPNVVALIGNMEYGTVSEALAAAKSGDTVKLINDSTEDMIIVWNGVTLDLNGCTLTVNNYLMNFANIIDGEDGGEGLLVFNGPDSQLVINANAFLPVFDSAAGGYRLYEFTFENLGSKKIDDNSKKYGITIRFANIEAYRLISESADTKLDIQFTIKLVGTTTSTMLYDLNYDTIKTWAKNAYTKYSDPEYTTGTRAIALTITGMKKLTEGTTLTVDSKLVSEVGMIIDAIAVEA